MEEAPRGIVPIAPDEWRDPLGGPVRTGDWIAFFHRAVRALLIPAAGDHGADPVAGSGVSRPA